MFSTTVVKLLRAGSKKSLAALVLVAVPVLVLTFLGSWNFSHWLNSRSDPALDVALLVEPSVSPGDLPGSGDGADNLMNWKYTAITTGS